MANVQGAPTVVINVLPGTNLYTVREGTKQRMQDAWDSMMEDEGTRIRLRSKGLATGASYTYQEMWDYMCDETRDKSFRMAPFSPDESQFVWFNHPSNKQDKLDLTLTSNKPDLDDTTMVMVGKDYRAPVQVQTLYQLEQSVLIVKGKVRIDVTNVVFASE